MTSLNWNIFRVTGPLWGEFTGHRWIPLTKDSDTEIFFKCLWTNGWANHRNVGDLRRNSVHYDVTVMHLYSCHYVVHRSLNTISEIVQTKMFLLHYNERYRIFGLQIYLIPGGLIDNVSAWTTWVFSAKPLPEQCWGRYLAHMYTTSHQWVNFKHFMRYIRSI